MIRNLVKTVATFCSKNASTILTVGACAGVAATGYFAFRSGVKTISDLQDMEIERAGGDITPKDKAMIIVKDCAVPAAVGGLTMAMIISSRIIDIRRAKAMAASYAILSESAEAFRRKCIEEMGHNRTDKVYGELAQEELDKHDFEHIDRDTVPRAGTGQFWVVDSLTKQEMLADCSHVWKIKSQLDRRVIEGDDYITVNEWLYYLGFAEAGEPIDKLVWPASMGIPVVDECDKNLPTGHTRNGEPAYVIEYYYPPMTEEEADIYNANHMCDTL